MTYQQQLAPEKKKESKAAQIVLSLIILVGFAVLLFVPDAALSDRGLFNQILDYFKEDVSVKFLSIAYYSFIGFYALLVICTVASFFTQKKGSFALNCIKTIAGIVVTVFYVYVLIGKLGSPIDLIFRDDKTKVALNSTVIMLAFGFVMMFALSISYYKGLGAAKMFAAIIALGYASMFFVAKPFIGEAALIDLFNVKFSYADGAMGTVISYAFIALAFAAAANLALAVLSLAVRKMTVLDLVRSVVMFVLAALCFVLLGVEVSFSNVFDYLGTAVFLGLALVQLVYAIVMFVAVRASARKKQDEPAFEVDANNQMAMAGLAAPATETAEEQVSENAARANAAFDQAAQISIDEIVAQNAAEDAANETAYADAVRDEAPAAEEVTEEEPEYDFEQKQHDGQFNRDYADYQTAEDAKQQADEEARRQAAAQAAEEAARQAAQQYGSPAQQPYAAPYGMYGAGYAQQYAQNAPGYYGGPVPYLPDAFINSLTPAERDEFDKLFITRVYGENKRLPVYVVGSDNREFFAKIFVFMGRYRNIISEGLLEKIYNYSNSIR